MRKYLILKSICDFHIIVIEDILYITSRDVEGTENKSEIRLKTTSDVLYSTEKVEDIYKKLHN